MVTVRTRSLDALEATMIIGHYTVWKKSIFHQEVCIYIYICITIYPKCIPRTVVSFNEGTSCFSFISTHNGLPFFQGQDRT